MLLPSVSWSGFLGGQRFAELGAALAAVAHLGAGFEAEAAVARAVEIELRLDLVKVLGLVAAGETRSIRPSLESAAKRTGIEQQGDVGLADDLVVEQQVPELRSSAGGCSRRRRGGTPRAAPPRASRDGRCGSWRRRRASSLRSRSCRRAASGPARARLWRHAGPRRPPRRRRPGRRPPRRRPLPDAPASCAAPSACWWRRGAAGRSGPDRGGTARPTGSCPPSWVRRPPARPDCTGRVPSR